MRLRLDRQAFLKSAAIFASLMAFFVPVLINQARDTEALHLARLKVVADETGRNLEQQLQSRVGVLEFFGRTVPVLHIATDSDFAAWSRPIRTKIPGFYAINFIDAGGTIRWVDPLEPNRAALGRQPKLRPEVAPYFERARTRGLPVVTHFLRLYQGPVGFVVYLPVYAGKYLIGFLNGVFTADEFMSFVVPKTTMPFAVDVRTTPRTDDYVYRSREAAPGARVGTYDAVVYGQVFHIEVRDAVGAGVGIDRQVDVATTLISVAAVILGVIISGISYMLMSSRRRLKERLESERFQGTLLNVLVHDLLNPLLVIRYSVDAARRMVDASGLSQLEKIDFALGQTHSLISRVRDIRAAHFGKLAPALGPVPINDVIAEALATFDPHFREKGIIADFRHSDENPSILVDRVIFQANVVGNVLANAVKYSDAGSRIVIIARTRRDQVVLEIEDQGMGMTPSLLARVLDEGDETITPGTRGETGTGIGMLQIMSYTRFFGGRVVIHSRSKSEHPDTHGTTVCLYLPRAHS